MGPAANRVLLSVALRGAPAEAAGRRLKRRALELMRALSLQGTELSLSVVGDRRMRALNRDWRGKDRATDVLSFPSGAVRVRGQRWPLGDLVISLETAKRAAAEHGERLSRELDRYLAHGLLHLLGHDHLRPAEARRMALAEARLLGRGGMLADSDETDAGR
ncbi:MAG: rRNA maturation RNase YbeY [Myxococcaceae bacterium]|nr:rRNA maturation RNase YbeY [Myxococcaceae bacterium]